MDEFLKGDESVDDDGYTIEDGCPVEPDGHRPHGYASPLLRLGNDLRRRMTWVYSVGRLSSHQNVDVN
jgi:hypothetical protein